LSDVLCIWLRPGKIILFLPNKAFTLRRNWNFQNQNYMFYILVPKQLAKPKFLFLKNFFAGKPIAIDAKVKVLITGKNNDIITQYVLFTKVIDEQRNLYKNNTQTAITETIRICKDKNILKEYLENHEKEVIDIMVTLYSQEEVLRDYVTSEKFTSEVKGIVELSQELGRSFADTVSYVAKKCNVSKDIAERKVRV